MPEFLPDECSRRLEGWKRLPVTSVPALSIRGRQVLSLLPSSSTIQTLSALSSTYLPLLSFQSLICLPSVLCIHFLLFSFLHPPLYILYSSFLLLTFPFFPSNLLLPFLSSFVFLSFYSPSFILHNTSCILPSFFLPPPYFFPISFSPSYSP